jgi:hypothetical protein
MRPDRCCVDGAAFVVVTYPVRKPKRQWLIMMMMMMAALYKRGWKSESETRVYVALANVLPLHPFGHGTVNEPAKGIGIDPGRGRPTKGKR